MTQGCSTSQVKPQSGTELPWTIAWITRDSSVTSVSGRQGLRVGGWCPHSTWLIFGFGFFLIFQVNPQGGRGVSLYRTRESRFWIKCNHQGFPGGAVVESLPANAGDMGSSPGLGGSHVPRSDWAREPQLRAPVHLEPVLRNKRGHDSERPAHRDEEWPPLAATRESPSTETKTQHRNQSINQ